ncbi:hypothetical protein SAMN02927900_03045 [Rhizobium mongolense subsp. loessense]|uniref:Uncharacterized protein n=1 Tax=Rhizobium mongolense subsp. loessense TaxID=158890 RepID=A0A1G4RV73_9HYPH|nr:hypothetical protein SAMN02927900_03045 [Rhizobium mongolense subsp. loessense]
MRPSTRGTDDINWHETREGGKTVRHAFQRQGKIVELGQQCWTMPDGIELELLDQPQFARGGLTRSRGFYDTEERTTSVLGPEAEIIAAPSTC